MKRTDLGKENIWKLVAKLAVPSMLAQFVNVLYSIVDRVYIGNMAEGGEIALAAIGVCAPVVTLISSCAYLIGMGGSPYVAIRMGEGNEAAARRILFNCVCMLTGVALLLTGVVLGLKSELLRWFGASDALYPAADAYFSWYASGSLFAVLAAGLNCFIICQGYSKTGMATVLIGAALNIALDPLFIFVFDMGVAGAAIATVIAQAASCFFSLGVLLSKRMTVPLRANRLSPALCGRVLLLGLSPFLIIATDSVLMIALNAVLQRAGGAAGDRLVTCATVVLSFSQIVTLPLGGITAGTQPILSFNYGARLLDRVKKGELAILVFCVVFTTVMFLVARFASAGFVGIFIKDPGTAAETVRYIKIFTLGIIPLAFQYAFVDGLTALGIARMAVSLSLFRKLLVMLPCIFLLPVFFGAEAAFWAEPAADLVSGIVSTTVFVLCINRILRRREKSGELAAGER